MSVRLNTNVSTRNYQNTLAQSRQAKLAKGGNASVKATVADQAQVLGSSSTLKSKIQEKVKEQFGNLAQDKGKFHETMKKVFGDSYDVSKAEAFRQSALKGQFSWLPPMRFVDNESLGGANGAYNKKENMIYINENLKNNLELAASTYAEEAGHGLDVHLNTSDTVGDEGEMFRRVLAGEKLSASQIQAIRNENDKGTITVDGKKVEVEFFLGKIAKGIGKLAKGAAKAVVGVGKGIVKSTVGLVKANVGFVSNLARGNFKGAFSSLAKGVFHGVNLASNFVGGGIGGLLRGGIGNLLRGGIGGILRGGFRGFFRNSLPNLLRRAFQVAPRAASNLLRNAGNMYRNGVNYLRNRAAAIRSRGGIANFIRAAVYLKKGMANLKRRVTGYLRRGALRILQQNRRPGFPGFGRPIFPKPGRPGIGRPPVFRPLPRIEQQIAELRKKLDDLIAKLPKHHHNPPGQANSPELDKIHDEIAKLRNEIIKLTQPGNTDNSKAPGNTGSTGGTGGAETPATSSDTSSSSLSGTGSLYDRLFAIMAKLEEKLEKKVGEMEELDREEGAKQKDPNDKSNVNTTKHNKLMFEIQKIQSMIQQTFGMATNIQASRHQSNMQIINNIR